MSTSGLGQLCHLTLGLADVNHEITKAQEGSSGFVTSW